MLSRVCLGAQIHTLPVGKGGLDYLREACRHSEELRIYAAGLVEEEGPRQGLLDSNRVCAAAVRLEEEGKALAKEKKDKKRADAKQRARARRRPINKKRLNKENLAPAQTRSAPAPAPVPPAQPPGAPALLQSPPGTVRRLSRPNGSAALTGD